MAGAYALGTSPKYTPIGHLIYSAYDYVVSETMDFHVDYDKTLGSQYKTLKEEDSNIISIDQSCFDSAIEKCEAAVKEMYRPISGNKTAVCAQITGTFNSKTKPLSKILTLESYEYIHQTTHEDKISEFSGRVSMYNTNTFKGRIYIHDEKRTVPFTLIEQAKSFSNQIKLAESLSTNVKSKFQSGDINVFGYRCLSGTGILKGILVTDILK